MKQRFQSLLLTSLASLTVAGSLTACFPLLVGGAAVGALVAVDRRTSGAQLEDEGIELRSSARLRDAFGDRVRVNVTSYNRQVLLTGEAPTEQDKQAVEQLIARVDNVRAVVNEITVMGMKPSLQQRTNDALTTGKVKASLIDAKDLQVNAFKVVTERGTVYLMGRVSAREADRATQITRTIPGVQRVVRIFEVLTEEELQQLSRARPVAVSPAVVAPQR
jgi:osmotically-inducible protein OsmY